MRKEIMEVFKHLDMWKASGPSEVYAKIILASGHVWISVDGTLPDRKVMPADWAVSVSSPFLKEKEISLIVVCIGVWNY